MKVYQIVNRFMVVDSYTENVYGPFTEPVDDMIFGSKEAAEKFINSWDKEKAVATGIMKYQLEINELEVVN